VRTDFIWFKGLEMFYYDFSLREWKELKTYHTPSFPTDLEREAKLIEEYRLFPEPLLSSYDTEQRAIVATKHWGRKERFDDYGLSIKTIDLVPCPPELAAIESFNPPRPQRIRE